MIWTLNPIDEVPAGLIADASAAMAAHVEERVDVSRSVANDDDALVADRTGEVVAGVRDLIGASRANPAIEVEAFELAAVEVRVGIESARQRRMHVTSGDDSPPGLKRALGRWDLTAVGINQVIG